MLEKYTNSDFDQIYSLMENSFPFDEYRSYDEQKALLENPVFSIYLLRDNNMSIKAFISDWEFDNFVFVEHFAVNPEYRNNGLGACVLKKRIKMSDKMICLEVEPPETNMSRRRIKFYKRNGFFLNKYPYIQPAISRGRKPIPLMLMTSPALIDQEQFKQIQDTLYREVYKCS